MKAWSRYWDVIIFVISALAITNWLLWSPSRPSRPPLGPPVRPLPAIDRVARVGATIQFGHRVSTFEVPKEYWSRLWATMEPANRDNHAAKWVALGEMDVSTLNGDNFVVHLYTLSEPPGAFSVVPPVGKRVYYRGGDSDALKRVLLEIEAADMK